MNLIVEAVIATSAMTAIAGSVAAVYDFISMRRVKCAEGFDFRGNHE